jgi:hypothetical protein
VNSALMVVKRRVRGHGLSPALRCRHQDRDLKQFSQSGAPQFTNATGMVSAAWMKPTASAVKEVTHQGLRQRPFRTALPTTIHTAARPLRSVCRWSCRARGAQRATWRVAGAFPSSCCPVFVSHGVSQIRRVGGVVTGAPRLLPQTGTSTPKGLLAERQHWIERHISCSQMSSLAALRAARPALGPLIAGGAVGQGLEGWLFGRTMSA